MPEVTRCGGGWKRDDGSRTEGHREAARQSSTRPPVLAVDGSGASADNSLRSAAEAFKGTLVSDGKRLEIRHFCFAACGSSIRQEVFAGPKSLDAPEPLLKAAVPLYHAPVT